MVEAYRALLSRAREWFERVAGAGWLDDADRHRFHAVEQAIPADLFAAGQMRPLVVALFGGTGVGKSSLLNRLAGELVARVGVERPTSHDVTLYVHDSVRLAELPPELPLERVQTRRHSAASRSQVLWIDAPDIDSVDESDRQCALAWLPHIDLVCYVVSPERYRDDAGWRVLRARGQKHGWMFVMNRWDEGNPQQREDCRRMLRGAGFDSPLLLCTCCAETPGPLPAPDEFDQIQATIDELIAAHAVRELTRLGHRARLQELRAALEDLLPRLGDDAKWETLHAHVHEGWERLRGQVFQGLAWAMQTAAARFAVRQTGFVQRVGRQLAGLRPAPPNESPAQGSAADAGELATLTESLWDDWSESKLVRFLDQVEISAGRAGIAPGPLRQRLDKSSRGVRELVLEPVQDEVRAALLRPGSLAVRVARRVTGFLTTALPAIAVAVVGYRVVVGYWQASAGGGSFLGTDFAVHSALLVLVAWGLPFLVDRMLRPSLEAAVLRAIRRGLGSGLEILGNDLDEALQQAADEAHQYRAEGEALLKDAAALIIRPLDARSPALARIISVGHAAGAYASSWDPGSKQRPEAVSGTGGQ